VHEEYSTMIRMTLAEVAHAVSGTLRLHADDTDGSIVSGVVDTDSREMTPGGLFVAKPGETTDGHLFVGAALAAGAVAAIVERPVEDAISQIVVADAKNMLARILQDEGETVAPRNSFNNEVGAPVTMLRITDDTRYLVSEFGASRIGRIAELAGLVTPDVGAVLMVGLAHAGGFGGVEATQKAKTELVEAVRPGGVAVLNADDPRVAAMAEVAASRGVEVRWFGRSAAAQVRGEDVEVTASGTTCTVVAGDERLPLRLRVLGEHHVMNALAALTIAQTLGVPLTTAIARLETVEIAERWRMQPLGSDRVRIINDAYNASPDSMAAALRTIAQIAEPGQRKVAVLGAMSELGEHAGEEHDRVGLLAVRLRFERIVVVGTAARRLYLAAIGEGSWDGEAVFFETQDEAYAYLVGELRDGDRVLVKSSNSAGLRHLGDRLGESFS
jgi:UDP-N-acetylmuramoyl-tripeptide--D-alanyl-D-alanine ligase